MKNRHSFGELPSWSEKSKVVEHHRFSVRSLIRNKLSIGLDSVCRIPLNSAVSPIPQMILHADPGNFMHGLFVYSWETVWPENSNSLVKQPRRYFRVSLMHHAGQCRCPERDTCFWIKTAYHPSKVFYQKCSENIVWFPISIGITISQKTCKCPAIC